MPNIFVCPACGATVEGEKKYCPNCGQALSGGGQNVHPFENQNPNSHIPPIPPGFYANSHSNYNNVPPYQNQPYMNMPPQMPQNTSASNGCAIAGMVLGIISIVLCCLNWVGIIIGGVGLGLSIAGLKSFQYKGPAIAGLICSICGILLGLIDMITILMG